MSVAQRNLYAFCAVIYNNVILYFVRALFLFYSFSEKCTTFLQAFCLDELCKLKLKPEGSHCFKICLISIMPF